MSDIKIQPSATGNAVVTITPGVSNSARTLTLPDASGTVATTADITSTTTTANAALPKGGGTMTGNLTVSHASGNAVTRLQGASNSQSSKLFMSHTSSGSGGLFYNSNILDIFSYGDIKINSGTGNVNNTITNERIIIKNDGRVGIGTSSPAFENGSGLEIRYAGGNGAHLKLTDNASGTGATQGLDLYMFNTQAYIENYENAPTIFRNNGAESVRILANGNVGIGTSSPDEKLDVEGTIQVSRTSGYTATWKQFISHASSAYNGTLYIDGSTSTGGVIFRPNGSQTVSFPVGGGITFGSDTAAANALDDYEEGTWTPSFNTGSPTYTTTYARTGTYTKIGNVVHVYMELYMGAISFGDATAIMEFSGLPFASKGIGNTFGMGMASSITWSSIYTNGSTYNTGSRADSAILSAQPTILASASVFRISLSGLSNTGRAYLKNAAFHNGSGMAIGFSYNTV